MARNESLETIRRYTNELRRAAIEVATFDKIEDLLALNPAWLHPGFEHFFAANVDGSHTLVLVPHELMPPRDAPKELPPAA